jgi:hypothetical protein
MGGLFLLFFSSDFQDSIEIVSVDLGEEGITIKEIKYAPGVCKVAQQMPSLSSPPSSVPPWLPRAFRSHGTEPGMERILDVSLSYSEPSSKLCFRVRLFLSCIRSPC